VVLTHRGTDYLHLQGEDRDIMSPSKTHEALSAFRFLATFTILASKTKLNSVALVSKQSILTEHPPHFVEVSVNFCG
jgi:hypothetical protein